MTSNVSKKNGGKISFFINTAVNLARSEPSLSTDEIETLVNKKWSDRLEEYRLARNNPDKQQYISFMKTEIPNIKKDLEESGDLTNKRQIHNIARKKAQQKWALHPENPKNVNKKLHPFATSLDLLLNTLRINKPNISDNELKQIAVEFCEGWVHDTNEHHTNCGTFLNGEIPRLTKELFENSKFNGFESHLQVYKNAMNNWKENKRENLKNKQSIHKIKVKPLEN